MASIWSYKYGEHTIVVKNGLKTELFVDDKKQDSKGGLHLKLELLGKLDSGEEVKASLFGTATTECMLHIDNVLQTPVQVE